MTFSLYLLYVIVFGVVFMQSVLDSMHYFQLNSYRFDTHVKWMRQNLGRFMPHNMLAVLLLIDALISFNIRAKLGIALALLIIAMKRKGHREEE